MKVLITGSKGLIGSALAVALNHLGIEVAGIDLKESFEHKHYGNILDLDCLEEKLRGCHGVIHLAAVSRVVLGEKNPQLCWQTNVDGTFNLVNAALKSRYEPWMIYASSREVYGQQEKLPVRETEPLQPLNIYGRSKAEAEKIVIESRKQGLTTAVLRFSNVYGSVNDHADRVIPAFCIASIKHTNMYVEGKDQLFDFTYIDDVINGILATIVQLSQSPKIELPPIHLTTGIPTSLNQIAVIANTAGGNHAKMIETPSRSYDVARFYGDPARANKILNWRPTVRVEEGICRLINLYRLHFQAQQVFQSIV